MFDHEWREIASMIDNEVADVAVAEEIGRIFDFLTNIRDPALRIEILGVLAARAIKVQREHDRDNNGTTKPPLMHR